MFAQTTSKGGTPADTFVAISNVAKAPSVNVEALFGLLPASPLYTPALTSAPADWAMAVSFTPGSSAIGPAAIDAAGHVWVGDGRMLRVLDPGGNPLPFSPVTATGLSCVAGIAIDSLQAAWLTSNCGPQGSTGAVVVISADGSPKSFSPITGNGLNLPQGIGIDQSGDVWVLNMGGAQNVVVLNFNGVPLGFSPITGANLVDALAVAFDNDQNAWIANSGFSLGVGNNVTVLGAAGGSTPGVPLSFSPIKGFNGPFAIVFDLNDLAWVANETAANVVILNSSGTQAGFSPVPWSQQIAIDAPTTPGW